jgi:hypothetical protein
MSHKAHCNYLPAVCLTGEESSIQVPLDMVQYNVTLTPMLRGKSFQLSAVMLESHTSREDWLRAIPRSTVSMWMKKVLYSSKTD